MTKGARVGAKEYVRRWQKAAPLLEQVRIRELRSPDYGKNWQVLDSFLEMAALHGKPRLTSGLVEQQRLFAKARR